MREKDKKTTWRYNEPSRMWECECGFVCQLPTAKSEQRLRFRECPYCKNRIGEIVIAVSGGGGKGSNYNNAPHNTNSVSFGAGGSVYRCKINALCVGESCQYCHFSR